MIVRQRPLPKFVLGLAGFLLIYADNLWTTLFSLRWKCHLRWCHLRRCHHALKSSAFKTESLFLPSDVQMQLLHSCKCSSWGFSAGRQYSCSLVFNKTASVKYTMCKRLYQVQHPPPVLCFIIPIFASSCWSKPCQQQASQTSFSRSACVWPPGFQARVVVYVQVPSPSAASSAAIAWGSWAALPRTLGLTLWGKRSPRGSAGDVRACRHWIWLHYFHTSCDLVILSETPGLPHLLVDQTVAWQQNQTLLSMLCF